MRSSASVWAPASITRPRSSPAGSSNASPKVILADEPTGNLDSQTSVDVMALFQELGQAGITIVLVTHEPDIAECASRVIVVKDGNVVTDRKQVPRPARTESPSSSGVSVEKREYP